MIIKTVGSVCSGIEAASVAWKPLGLDFSWLSEIADFPSRVLAEHYPEIINLGDMNAIPDALIKMKIDTPDIICGGTPCQAFSLAGWKNGLNDNRGNLTLRFVDIVEANDQVRLSKNLDRSIVFWENVEGVLTDKTNAFGCLVSSLAGLDEIIKIGKWPNAGLIYGPKRNVAWRILDAKYFGLPQQRRRLYLLAGGKEFHPEWSLFEEHKSDLKEYPKCALSFEKDGHRFEIFREYTDCLYSAYGTKWNGNAAATNGSLFVVQDNRIRRLMPLEVERLMGLPDNYTNLPNSKKTSRYQAAGNSWAVPVVQWLGQRIIKQPQVEWMISSDENDTILVPQKVSNGVFYSLENGIVPISNDIEINCTAIPENPVFGSMHDIVAVNNDESIFISPVGCYGIVRRKNERNTSINPRLEEILLMTSSKMPAEEIEKRSRIQHRGQFGSVASEAESSTRGDSISLLQGNQDNDTDGTLSNIEPKISIDKYGQYRID